MKQAFRRAGIDLVRFVTDQNFYIGSSPYSERDAVLLVIAPNHSTAVAFADDPTHLRDLEQNIVQGLTTQEVFHNLVIYIPDRSQENVRAQVRRAKQTLAHG
jgi:hypothetical protein